MLPTFLVIGAMKAGTTSLHRYLDHHPQIFMSKPKELNFFTVEGNWYRGREWYEACFAEAGSGVLAAGESSTNYAKHPEFTGVPSRIARVLPDVRLVYVLRHPVERMRSHYLHRFARGKEQAPIEEALLRNATYVNTSRYAMQIERFLEHVPRERLLVLTTERLRNEREETLLRIYEFVGVDPDFTSPSVRREFYRTAEHQEFGALVSNLRRIPGVDAIVSATPLSLKRATRRLVTHELDTDRAKISERLRRRLEGLVRDDVRRLHGYLDDEFDGWGIA